MSELQLIQTEAPGEEPLTLKQAKDHLRVELDEKDEDDLIRGLMRAATNAAEAFLRRQLITATYELYLDAFPKQIDIPRPPLQSVTSIKYTDTDGDEQTLDTGVYTVDTKSMVGRVVLAYNQSWPSTRAQIQAVKVTYVAGYGERTAVEPDIVAGLKLHIGHLFEHREDVVLGISVAELPKGSESLYYPYRVLGGY